MKQSGVILDQDGVPISSTLVSGKQALDANVANEPSINVQDGAGTDITSTLVSGKQGLDVNVVNSISASIPVAATATLSNVASSASSVSLLASNASRKGFMLYNDSSKGVYVKFGATASSTSFSVYMEPKGYFEPEGSVYTGAIDAIWVAANGNMRVTELS